MIRSLAAASLYHKTSAHRIHADRMLFARPATIVVNANGQFARAHLDTLEMLSPHVFAANVSRMASAPIIVPASTISVSIRALGSADMAPFVRRNVISLFAHAQLASMVMRS